VQPVYATSCNLWLVQVTRPQPGRSHGRVCKEESPVVLHQKVVRAKRLEPKRKRVLLLLRVLRTELLQFLVQKRAQVGVVAKVGGRVVCVSDIIRKTESIFAEKA
jgi:hypothetical protein